MADVREPAAKPKVAASATPAEAPRIDYKARPVAGEVDVSAIHRDLARRYPVIRAYLAK